MFIVSHNYIQNAHILEVKCELEKETTNAKANDHINVLASEKNINPIVL